MFDYWRDHPHPLTIGERKEKNRIAAMRRLKRMRARKGPITVKCRPWGGGFWLVGNSHDPREYGPFTPEAKALVIRMMFAGEWNPAAETLYRVPDEVIHKAPAMRADDGGRGEQAAA